MTSLTNLLFKFYHLVFKPAVRVLGFTPHAQACRFTPVCSQYCKQAINTRGIIRGSWLCFRRLTKCHPFHSGGHDPLPRQATVK